MSYQDYEQWKTTPMGGAPEISIVIPTANAELLIVPTIGAVASYMTGLGRPWELLISDDGSTDQTAQLVEDLGLANVQVLRSVRPQGKGHAVRCGMLLAHGTYVLSLDADNATPIEESAKLLAKLEQEQYTLAVGLRLTPEPSGDGARRSRAGGRNPGVRDPHSGFKMFTREAAHRLHMSQTLAGPAGDLEILYLAAKFGYRIAEVAVAWVGGPGAVDPTKDAPGSLGDLARIRLNDFRGIYAKA